MSMAESQNNSEFAMSENAVFAGESLKVTINSAESSYFHRFALLFMGLKMESMLSPGETGTIITVPIEWLSVIPGGSVGAGVVVLEWYAQEDGPTLGSTSQPLTIMAPASAAPDVGTVNVTPLLTVDGVTYPEVAPEAYVQGKSGYSAAITGAAGKYGAGIASYGISGGGYSGNNATLKSGLLMTAGAQTITFKVTDTRGLSASKTLDIDVTAYATPRVTELTAWRTDETGAANGMGTRGMWRTEDTFSKLGGYNALSAKTYIKAVGGEETELGALAAGGVTPTWSRYAFYLSGGNAGKETPSTNRVADLTYYEAARYALNITPHTLAQYILISYDADKNYIGKSSWLTGSTYTLTEGTVYFRVELSYRDSRTITDENLAVIADIIKLVDTSANVWWIAGTNGAKLALDVTKRYVLRRVLTDAYGTVERSVEIPSANFAMHLNAKGNGICFGGASSEENAVEIAPEYDLVFKGTRHARLWEALELYPVGAVYISASATSPAEIFGGTWARIEGRFLLGASTAYTVGKEGGAAEVTLTTAQMPSHQHTFSRTPITAVEQTGSGNYFAEKSTTVGSLVTQMTETAGGGQAHDNMPPYLAVYMWQRTE